MPSGRVAQATIHELDQPCEAVVDVGLQLEAGGLEDVQRRANLRRTRCTAETEPATRETLRAAPPILVTFALRPIGGFP